MPTVWCDKCGKKVESVSWQYSEGLTVCTVVAKCHGEFDRYTYQVPDGFKGITSLRAFEDIEKQVTADLFANRPFCEVINRPVNLLCNIPASQREVISVWAPLVKDSI